MTRPTDTDVPAAPGLARLPDPPEAALWRRVPVLLLLGAVLLAGSALLGLKAMMAVTLSVTAVLLGGALLLIHREERRSPVWVYAAADDLAGLSAADLRAQLVGLQAAGRVPWMPPLVVVLFAPALLLALPPLVVAGVVLVWGALAAWGARVFAAWVVRQGQVSVVREALLRLE